MPTERTVATERIYDGRVVALERRNVTMADGRRVQREVVLHAPVVAIVPVDEHGRVLLVRQWRTPVERELLEVPAGGVDGGESPEEAVQRELQEEVGVRAGEVVRLAGLWVAPGYCTEHITVYLARDLAPSRLEGDEDEAIVVVPLPLADALAAVASGEICDAKSVIGLLLAAQRLGAG